jgi:hypothetical protein
MQNLFDHQDVINWIIGIFSAIIAFFGGRKSKSINEKGGEISNISSELQNLAIVRKMEKELMLDSQAQVKESREMVANFQIILDQKDSIISEQKLIIRTQLENITKQKKIIARQNRFIAIYEKKCNNFCVNENYKIEGE